MGFRDEHPLTDDVRDTLAIVNVARSAFDLPLLDSLPEASVGNAASCLYARAFGDISNVNVGGDGHMQFSDDDNGRRAASIIARLTGGRQTAPNAVKTPAVFERVISAFDAKEFPEFRLGNSSGKEGSWDSL